eukprot:gb/GECH01014143.1/.p1 GENE.gb/GECH01014143.1/~~gb/GECH01014143.1/.p1  ORF type:complete len:477 (+),score=100.34 gb/GECH01014143.1/:1-1431(+)
MKFYSSKLFFYATIVILVSCFIVFSHAQTNFFAPNDGRPNIFSRTIKTATESFQEAFSLNSEQWHFLFGWWSDQHVDDCFATVGQVEQANRKAIFPLTNQLVNQTFFKYFKADVFKGCSFWAQEFLCGLDGGCSVCECDDDEIPKPWKAPSSAPINRNLDPDFHPEAWGYEVDPQETGIYVNLKLNPEANTGYGGKDAARIWRAIYAENCFPGGDKSSCLQHRVLFRLLSGLHSSISAHVANYALSPNGTLEHTPNWKDFNRRVLAFPERTKNLYFTWAFVLRAVSKAGNYLSSYPYDTGNPKEDQVTQELVDRLVNAPVTCNVDDSQYPPFNESALLDGDDAPKIREEIRDRFRNISLLMDCVSCEKCRVWSKLEVMGLATSLRILLAEDPTTVIESLHRNEIIALINLLRQLSNSINDTVTIRSSVLRMRLSPFISIFVAGFFSLLILVQLCRLPWSNPNSTYFIIFVIVIFFL